MNIVDMSINNKVEVIKEILSTQTRMGCERRIELFNELGTLCQDTNTFVFNEESLIALHSFPRRVQSIVIMYFENTFILTVTNDIGKSDLPRVLMYESSDRASKIYHRGMVYLVNHKRDSSSLFIKNEHKADIKYIVGLVSGQKIRDVKNYSKRSVGKHTKIVIYYNKE